MCLNTVAAQLRDAFGKFLLHQNSSLCTVSFKEKVLTLAKSRGYGIPISLVSGQCANVQLYNGKTI